MPVPQPSNTQPDITAPVSNNGNRFNGIIGNMDNGTAKGPLTAGNANNNIGGTVYRAAGQSANQFPISPADQIDTGSGGSAPAITNSSQNPLTVQAQVLDRSLGESVVETTPALVSKSSAGNFLTFPKTTEVIELGNGTSSSVSSNLTIKNEQPANTYVGITDTIFNGNSNDLTVLAEERRIVVDTEATTKGHVDGADNLHFPVIYPSGQQLYTVTQREALPGGVVTSSEIGETNVDGIGI
jgi:hypothetical protein